MDEVNVRRNKNRLVIYTALFGAYDELADPVEKFPGCDFVCFTDQEDLKSSVWNIRLVNSDLLPHMMNRKYKMFPHKYLSEYSYSLYVDANIILRRSPLVLVEKYLTNSDFSAPRHFARNCIYDEAKECIVLKRDDPKKIRQQMHYYKAQGMPSNYGLFENNILLRRHNSSEIIELMHQWWQELNIRSKRDQLSLPFLMWKNDLKPAFMNETSRNRSGFFSIKPHANFNKAGFNLKLKNKINYTLRRLFLRFYL